MKSIKLPLVILLTLLPFFLISCDKKPEEANKEMSGMDHSKMAAPNDMNHAAMKNHPPMDGMKAHGKKMGGMLRLGFDRSKSVHLNNYYTYPTIKAVPMGVFLHFHNTAKAADELVSITSSDAEAVELHETTEGEDGVIKMRPLEKLVLTAGETRPFVPGGSHIMLINLTKNFAKGDNVELTLTFKKAGEIKIQVPVIRRSGTKSNHSMH